MQMQVRDRSRLKHVIWAIRRGRPRGPKHGLLRRMLEAGRLRGNGCELDSDDVLTARHD